MIMVSILNEMFMNIYSIYIYIYIKESRPGYPMFQR